MPTNPERDNIPENQIPETPDNENREAEGRSPERHDSPFFRRRPSSEAVDRFAAQGLRVFESARDRLSPRVREVSGTVRQYWQAAKQRAEGPLSEVRSRLPGGANDPWVPEGHRRVGLLPRDLSPRARRVCAGAGVAAMGALLVLTTTPGTEQPDVRPAAHQQTIAEGARGAEGGAPAPAPAAPQGQSLGAAPHEEGAEKSTFGVVHQWAVTASSGAGAPPRALEAYAHAHRALEKKQPGCNIPWTLLAGIGRVESKHGSYGSAELGPDGRPTDPIIGIPLDGTNNTKKILDTDDGRWDGDPVYDRAVGPMQFIPNTWNKWATDGNGDGVADPHSLDDAAATAGNYLCSTGGDLSSEDAAREALMMYNESSEYGRKVLGFAEEYGEGAGVPLPSVS